MSKLVPHALRDVPNLIESGVFPVQKLSYEAQRERKSGSGQILPTIGGYWKGRKPLILIRAVILGMLLPKIESDENDLLLFEKLLAFDDHGLARRAFSKRKVNSDLFCQADISVTEQSLHFDIFDSNSKTFRWKNSITEQDKLDLIGRGLSTLGSYAEKAKFCSRPEEVDQNWLYQPIWPKVQDYYSRWGVSATSFEELVEQMGMLRFGHCPIVGDTFAGGGSVPFEAARLGCDVYAADLNPVACMLNWGAFNIIGASKSRVHEIGCELGKVREIIQNEVNSLGYEKSKNNEQAKAYLYCHETVCPETGWTIPISGSWVISEAKSIIVKMIPNHEKKIFNLDLKTGASKEEMEVARLGTAQKGWIIYERDGRTYKNSLRSLRGDYIDKGGAIKNSLRQWTKLDIEPRDDDLFTERLYAIQWYKAGSTDGRNETYFCEPTEFDLHQEAHLNGYVKENMGSWQTQRLIPEMEIELGQKTFEPIRTRGWTHWHHFFNPRQLLLQKTIMEHTKKSKLPAELLILAVRAIDYNNRGCRWTPSRLILANLFYNQALNTLWNYGSRSSMDLLSKWKESSIKFETIRSKSTRIYCRPANNPHSCDIYVTDPPYADAVYYHEITEIFISWLQGELPAPFNEWTWDSRRPLAIKGSGNDFKQSMIEAYREITLKMPDHGYQCVMFTHSSIKVWADIANVLWASGLQVVSAWCVATETPTSIREGNHIQGTVILVLKKRRSETRAGYKQIILSKLTSEVEHQVKTMMNLNEEIQGQLGETTFSNADITLAGQASALKILTSYTSIDGQDVKAFALRSQGNITTNVVEDIVSRAIDIANSFLIPDPLRKTVWEKISGLERFYLQMMATDTEKLDTYQRYAKLHRVIDYYKLMSSTKANHARLTFISEFHKRDLRGNNEIGRTWLGSLIVALQELSASNANPEAVLNDLQNSVSDFLLAREDLINILEFIEVRTLESEVREAASLLIGQLKNYRVFNQRNRT